MRALRKSLQLGKLGLLVGTCWVDLRGRVIGVLVAAGAISCCSPWFPCAASQPSGAPVAPWRFGSVGHPLVEVHRLT